MTDRLLRVGILATHPIQYYAPWYRALAKEVDLQVFFSHKQTAEGQAEAGFGVAFDWDVPLLDGYRSTFLHNVARQPSVERFWGCDTPELPEIIRRSGFDAFIVHGWSTRSYWQAMQACWRTDTPVLVRGDSSLLTPRSKWLQAVKFPLYRWFVPKFDGYLVVGSSAQQYLVHYGADTASCFPAPHAVDNDFFATRADELRADRAALRRTFDLPASGIVFLFSGRFIERKAPEAFVRAIASVSRDVPGICGLMAGDGALRARTEALASALKAPVRFAGFLNQTAMVGAYAASDVAVVPSVWETWGLVVNEAMACGLPAIVTSGVACAGDLVVPHETGDVVPVGDERALAEAMHRMAADTPYRQTVSKGARERVERFSVSAAVAGTLRAIRSLSGTGSARTSPSVAVGAGR